MASNPANRIMRDFYHQTETPERPQILGLTASPRTRGKAGELESIESNLDAIARTPKLHREELLRYTFEPELVRLQYQNKSPDASPPADLRKLANLYSNLDIEKDPYIIKCRADPSASDSKQLRKALNSRKTYCQDQIKSLYNKSAAIFEELGSWATQYFIYTTIENFCSKADVDDFSPIHALDDSEKSYLKEILRTIKSPCQKTDDLVQSLKNEDDLRNLSLAGSTCLSAKARCLVDYLASVDTTELTGLVFVQTRAACAVLGQILSTHEKTRNKLRVSTFVGMSSSPNRKFDMGELVDVKNQTDTLEHMRHGHKNLILATSVLEEGIDISACNVVICFEKPPNLKAFIQRRGRARKSRSKYVLMFPEDDNQSQLAMWEQLEDEMRKSYMDEMRKIEYLRAIEDADTAAREFCVQSTGAKITLEDAVQHLYHFCATLPTDPYADLRPIFTFTGTHEGESIKANVSLPNSVDSSVREASSLYEWASEKLARRDAAFEAYIALYHANLVSDNLLPLRGQGDEAVAEAQKSVQKIVSLVDINEQLDIWSSIAREWYNVATIHISTVLITQGGSPWMKMLMILPKPLPNPLEIDLYWDAFKTLKATIEPGLSISQDMINTQAMADCTALLLRSVFPNRMEVDQTDFVAHFVPAEVQDLFPWLEQYRGTFSAESPIEERFANGTAGIIRDLTNNGAPHTFGGLERLHSRMSGQLDGATQSVRDPEIEEENEEEIFIRARRLPKRADFLHAIPLQDCKKVELSSTLLRASECTVDKLPFIYSQFALFVPSILHKVEINMIAEDLRRNLLSSVEFSDLSLVITAISTTASQESTNYQRLEFLGDSILKTMVSLTLLATHVNWHEGVLSHQKDHIVSNANLARACIAKGLDKYILTKPFTGHKWRPLYISNMLSEQVPSTRQLSTKTLADVVESLIGAAYCDGGITKALACLQSLLPATQWAPLDQLCATLNSVYDIHVPLPPPYEPLETLIGHNFKLPSLLLEAITHPSHHGRTPSYQRLEFLGDSVLDRIITVTAFSNTPPIETHTLHLIRTALVNANFLAYHSLTLSTPLPKTSITTNLDGTFTPIEATTPLALWTFMRHSSPAIRTAQAACQIRFQRLAAPIHDTFLSGTHYPWTLLAALEAPKFFSDIVEAVIGAIYIDTGGELAACEAFLERMGVMPYLRRVMWRGEGAVAVKHPKEELGVVADKEGVRYEVFRGGEKGEGLGGGSKEGEGLGGGNKEEEQLGGSNKEEEPGSSTKADEPSSDNDAETVQTGAKKKGELKCRVWVGERMVVEVGAGLSAIEVETRAAEEAVGILKKEKGI
ncbi:MAG: hypothetical protein Q9195_000656 [Heterodermia aff. obscurata]